MPADMTEFLISIPDTEDLQSSGKHIHSARRRHYFVGDAFSTGSKLTTKQQKSSSASKAASGKKRQKHALSPDMTIYRGSQAYAIIEAAKTQDDTKQLFETYKRCPELMVHIFNQLLTTFPTTQRSIKVYGCLLSRLNCTPLELSNPRGYVKIFKRGKVMAHPQTSFNFKARMSRLLAFTWQFRLAIEAVCTTLGRAEYEQSEFV